MKPRVMSLVVFTGFVGLVARRSACIRCGRCRRACMALGSGAAGALNMWYDATSTR
jgi:protoheme IX farnesyltransferase